MARNFFVIKLSRAFGNLSAAAFAAIETVESYLGLPKKITQSLDYRRSWRKYFPTPTAVESSLLPREKCLWIHGASLGELEDVAAFFTNEKLLRESGFSFAQLVLTSSSPSALGALQKWQSMLQPVYAGPLPPEDRTELRDFLAHFTLDTFILSHSDFWPVALDEIRARAAQILWLPKSLRTPPHRLTTYCLDPEKTWIGARELLETSPTTVANFRTEFIGALRLDRILERIQRRRDRRSENPDHVLEKYQAAPDPQKISVLVGSAWPEDAQFIATALAHLSTAEQAQFQWVVIPHEIKDAHILAQIQSHLPGARILSVEGVLLEAYENFRLAFVGGGLGTGLHSVIEAALWDLPVVCGADLRKQPEAPALVRAGLLFPQESPEKFAHWLRALLRPDISLQISTQARATAAQLRQQKGASARLAGYINKIRSRIS